MHRIPRRGLPALSFRAENDEGETARYFPDKLPIGVDRDGYTFLYLVTRDVPVDFRAFLERHAELLRSSPQ
jgi:hypothetical protein